MDLKIYPKKITDACAFFKNIQEINYNRSIGISKTLIIFGKIEETNVVVKIFLDITKKPDDLNKYQWLKVLYTSGMYTEHEKIEGLKYESRLYSYITEKIIEPGYSDNFIFCLGSGYCDKKQILENKKGSQILDSLYDRVYRFKKQYEIPIGLTITQNVPNSRIAYDIFEIFSENDRNVVMFQYTYAIALMEYFRISHNDLHLQNTLIRTLNTSKKYAYIIKGQRYVINTRYIPLIFDWDYGYAEELGPNLILNKRECNTTGRCSSFKYLADIFKIGCQSKYKRFEEIFSQVDLDREITEKDIKVLNNLNPRWIEDNNYYYEIDSKVAVELKINIPSNINKFLLKVNRKTKKIEKVPGKNMPCFFVTTYSLVFEKALDIFLYMFGDYIDDTTDVEKTYIFPE